MTVTARTGRPLLSRVDRFAGLSDRSIPVQLTRIESADLRNVEFSGRVMERRNGFKRVHTSVLRDGSLQLDGTNDFLFIRHQTRYQPTNRLFLSIDTMLTAFPGAAVTLLSKGYGTGANRFLQITYDPTVNSNNGGWILRVYDNTAGALRTLTVNDGSGSSVAAPVNTYRHLEFGILNNATHQYSFTVYDSAGATIGSQATGTVQTFITNSTPWWIGVDTNGSSGSIRGTDYYPGVVAEFRLADKSGGTLPSCAGVIGRELYSDPASTELDDTIGYWKLNDGLGPTFADTYLDGSDNNPAVAGGAGWSWVRDTSLTVLGTGLEFHGAYDPGSLAAPAFFGGFIWWQVTAAVGTSVGQGDPFTDTITGFRNWCVDCVYVPRMAEGETTVRNQTIFWSGTDATNPAPVGLRVVSNRLQAYYWDGTTLTSPTPPAIDLSTLVNTKIHLIITLSKHPVTGTSDRLGVQIRTSSAVYSSFSEITSAINPTSISAHWSIGDKLNSVTAVPPTTRGDNAYGIIQLISIRKLQTALTSYATYAMSFSYSQSFFPTPIGGLLPFTNTVAQLPLDDGIGQRPRIIGSQAHAAYLYPDPFDGFQLGRGIVDPFEPPFSQPLKDWKRLDPDGAIKRSLLVMAGGTLYELDVDTGTATQFTTGLPKSIGGPWSADQYGTTIYLAGRNGYRPIQIGDGFIKWVGIEAPQTAPVITSDTASGSIPTGTYTVYVTYRNAETGQESNPSPAGSFTLGAAGRVTAVAIPISADPQVNLRRIWITAAGGGTAYLQATIANNSDTSYATAITSLSTTTSMEATDNQEAPPGSLVAVWKDRLWVAGHPRLPTRLYFSSAGGLTAFNHTTDFLDGDLDSGDAIVKLEPMGPQLAVYFRDGVRFITATGDDSDPFFMSDSRRDHGSVGPLAVVPFESGHFFLGERDLFLGDQASAFNLSSPNAADRPSVQTLLRNSLEPSRRKDASLAIHRSRNQLWCAVSSDGATRNDTILVYDYSQGIFSRYDMEMDALIEVEDDTDEPWIYGTSRGYVCKLDTGNFDGYGSDDAYTVIAGTASSGATTSLTASGASWTTNRYKGLKVYWYDVSAGTTRSARIARNTGTVLTFTEAVAEAPASGDPFVIGGFTWYADFIADFGNPMQNKRLVWFTAKGESDAANVFRLSVQADQDGRTWSYSPTEYVKSWGTSLKFMRLALGGVGRSFRIRVADTGYSSATGSTVVPSVVGRIGIFEFALEAEELEAY